jgi:hypothetical protein
MVRASPILIGLGPRPTLLVLATPRLKWWSQASYNPRRLENNEGYLGGDQHFETGNIVSDADNNAGRYKNMTVGSLMNTSIPFILDLIQ